MASTNSGGGGGDDGMVEGINVTPLVDIILVLLIIYMVTAKVIHQQALALDLPKAAKGQDIQTIFGIQVFPTGDVRVDNKPIPTTKLLMPLAKEALAKNPDIRAVIHADKSVQHGKVMEVMDLLKQAGVSKIAFGVNPVPPEPGAAPAGTSDTVPVKP